MNIISIYIDESAIRYETEKYWKLYDEYREQPVNRLKYYIDHLLPEEIKSYNQRHNADFRYHSPVKYLILLVGYSCEPLLQSICFHQPEYIIPVISEEYGTNSGGDITKGWDIYDRLSEVIRYLHEKTLVTQPLILYPGREEFEPVPSRPEKVFQYLIKYVIPKLDQNHSVVIDITGAKKNMVASAYLFGAYANIPITYVDFVEYNEIYGRPYGYTMEITELKNPYHAFSLHRWKRVQNLYMQNAFKAARVEIKEIISSMENTEKENSGNSFFSEAQKSAARKLAKLIELYELWENGEYYRAGNLYKELNDKNINLPSAINALSNIWPSNKKDGGLLNQVTLLETGSEKNEPIFLNKKALLNYVYDELAKIKRLFEKHADYRSAFQRAGGLNDVLLSARLNILWYKDYLELKISNKDKVYNKCSDLEPSERSILGKLFISTFKIRDLIYKNKKIKVEHQNHTYELILRHELKFKQLYKDKDFDWFRKMRNKAVHFAFSPSQEDTKRALDLICQDVTDFVQNWAGFLGHEKVKISTEPLDWEEVCKLCGIDFLPPSKEAEHGTVPAGR